MTCGRGSLGRFGELPKFGVSLVPNSHLPMRGVPTITHPFAPERVHVLHFAATHRLASVGGVSFAGPQTLLLHTACLRPTNLSIFLERNRRIVGQLLLVNVATRGFVEQQSGQQKKRLPPPLSSLHIALVRLFHRQSLRAPVRASMKMRNCLENCRSPAEFNFKIHLIHQNQRRLDCRAGASHGNTGSGSVGGNGSSSPLTTYFPPCKLSVSSLATSSSTNETCPGLIEGSHSVGSKPIYSTLKQRDLLAVFFV